MTLLPNDPLAIATRITSELGLTAGELVAKFDSFGDNCEFGFVQRHFGAEPLGAFRFANPRAEMIIEGLGKKFADLGTDVVVELDQQQPRREWILVDRIYDIRQHSFIWEGDPREVTIAAKMRRHCKYLRDKLIEDLVEGNKIYVIKSVPDVRPELARRVAAGVRNWGTGSVLWVVDQGTGPAIEDLGDGLLRGCVNGILPQGHPRWGEFAWSQWLAVMAGAWKIVIHS